MPKSVSTPPMTFAETARMQGGMALDLQALNMLERDLVIEAIRKAGEESWDYGRLEAEIGEIMRF